MLKYNKNLKLASSKYVLKKVAECLVEKAYYSFNEFFGDTEPSIT